MNEIWEKQRQEQVLENVDYHERFDMDYVVNADRSDRFSKALQGTFGDADGEASAASGATTASTGTKKDIDTTKSSSSKGKAGDVAYTPLEKQVLALRSLHPNCLLMVECGYRIRFFGDDALLAAQVLSIYAHKDHSFQVASVPTHRFLVHARRLVAAGCRVGLVRQTETAALRAAGKKSSSSTFERKVVAMYTPGTVIDDDDPAFSDMLSSSASSSSAEDGAGLDEGEPGYAEENKEEGVEEAPEAADDNSWLSSVGVSESGDVSVVSISVRGHRVRHRTFTRASYQDSASICQELGDYFDMWRPVEVLLDRKAAEPLWEEALQRSSGAVEGRGSEASSSSSSSSSEPASTGGDSGSGEAKYIKRLCRRAMDTSLTYTKLPVLAALGEATLRAVALLEAYLTPFGLVAALDEPIMECDDAPGALDAPEVGSTAIKKKPLTFRLDPVTAADLEVFVVNDSQESVELQGKSKSTSPLSLLQHINYCKSAFGRRTLSSWLAAPLRSLSGIHARQECISFFLESGAQSGDSSDAARWWASVSSALTAQPDAERMLASLHHRRLSPRRTLLLLRWVMKVCVDVKASSDLHSHMPPMLQSLLTNLDLASVQDNTLRFIGGLNQRAAEADDMAGSFGEEMLAEAKKTDKSYGESSSNPVAHLADTKDAYNAALDNMQTQLETVRQFLRKPNLHYRTLNTGGAGIEHLIEVDIKDCAPKGGIHIPEDWVQMNSTKSINRYHPPQVLTGQGNLFRARDEMRIAAKEAWAAFLQTIGIALHSKLRTLCEALGVLDTIGSLAKVASMPGYVQPQFTANENAETGNSATDARFSVHVQGARHPMAERILEKDGRQFQPNDLLVRGGHCSRSCLVVTGPNMGGKSSYVRTAALISLMGQIGSWVPATSASLPIFDNIFTRMGADDDLARGRSTFLNELHRTSRIIRNATSKSLVILDELGRGTSTHDGVAIAIATLKHLVRKIGCATLFVTHYAQISDLAASASASTIGGGGDDAWQQTANVHMSYIEGESDGAAGATVTFLYTAVEGPSAGSYGLNVARTCGLDEDFLKLAAQASQWMHSRSDSSMQADAISNRGPVGEKRNGAAAVDNDEDAGDTRNKKTRCAEDVPVQADIPAAAAAPAPAVNPPAAPTRAIAATNPVEEERLALQRLIEQSKQRLQQLEDKAPSAELSQEDKDKVRLLVEKGDVQAAAAILHRHPRLEGLIVHGEKRGRTIGYPTANLGEWSANASDTVPADGIYAGWLCVESVEMSDKKTLEGGGIDESDEGSSSSKQSEGGAKKLSGDAVPAKGNHGFCSPVKSNARKPSLGSGDTFTVRLPAAISIGTNPTFAGERSRQVEAYCLDQESWIDLYGKRARIEFGCFLRPTIKFEGASWLEDLLAQMDKDCQKARDLCSSTTV